MEKIKRTWQSSKIYAAAQKAAVLGVLAVITVLVTIFSVIIYWKVAPYEGIRYDGPPQIDPTKTYYPGDFVEIKTAAFCNDGYGTKIERKIGSKIGNLGLLPIEFYAPTEPVCVEGAVNAVQIPEETPPGEWQIIIKTTYEPNPVRAITIERVTEFFTVVANPNSPSGYDAKLKAAGNSSARQVDK